MTDGIVSLRVPSVGDVDTFVRYAAGEDGGLGQAWLPQLHAGASRERCLWMVAEWLAGWAGEGSYNGPALMLMIARSPWPVGMVGFVCRGAGTIGLVHCVAPSWRGQGLATRAVVLAAGWLIRERGADVVELRRAAIPRRVSGSRSSPAFRWPGRSAASWATGTLVEDLRYIAGAAERGVHSRAAS